jgi:tyrosyl-DNA phosphodiesterase-1
MSWLQLIRQYDYSTAYAILIPSVPGRHRRNVYDNFGYLKLRQAIILSTSPQKQNGKRTTPPAPLICQISSIGSLNVKWLDQFLSAIDSSSTHELDPEHDISSSGKDGKKSVHTDKQRPLSSRLKIVWPTMEEIRTSIEGYSGGGVSVNANSITLRRQKYATTTYHLTHLTIAKVRARDNCKRIQRLSISSLPPVVAST